MKKGLIIAGIGLLVFICFIPRVFATKDFSVIIGYRDGHISLVKAHSTRDYASIIKQHMIRDDVLYVERDAQYHLTATPSDPKYSSQGYLPLIKAPQAWDAMKGSASVIVAVLDSGVDVAHPDLQSNIWTNPDEKSGNKKDDDGNGFIDDVHGWDFVSNSNNIMPRFSGSSQSTSSHGTAIAGIIGAVGNNALGVTGINWNVKVMPVRVLGVDGQGYTSAISRGIEYATNQGARIINISAVGNEQSRTLSAAISVARSKGVLVIASAGNDNTDLTATPLYPVCDEGVIGVGSIEDSLQKADFSSYGSCIDLVAPGVGIATTVATSSESGFSESYATGWVGTSFSAPMVAGVAALALSRNPCVSGSELENQLANLSSDSVDEINPDYQGKLGKGIINAEKAIANTKAGQSCILSSAITRNVQPLKFMVAAQDGTQQYLKLPVAKDVGAMAQGDINHDGFRELLVATTAQIPKINIYTSDFSLQGSISAFGKASGGISLASLDTNADGADEILAAKYAEGPVEVKIMNDHGQLIRKIIPYPRTYTGGVSIAAGLLGAGKEPTIVVGAGEGALPKIKLFDSQGIFKKEFFAFEKKFKHGINLAIADVDGDGLQEIIASPRKKRSPQIKVFSADGKLKAQFFAYAKKFVGGVSLAAADVSGDGIADIITGARAGGGPQVRIFSFKGKEMRSFFSYDDNFTKGINVFGYSP